jgi:hypothetical protein
VGQIVAYGGHPSWVFMSVDVAGYDSRVVCMLPEDRGATVAAGAFEVHNGVDQFSWTLRVDGPDRSVRSRADVFEFPRWPRPRT